MRPLDPLVDSSNVAELLKRSPPGEVAEELTRLAEQGLSGNAAAALAYAHGALALREGRLDDARAELEKAAEAYRAGDESEAAALSSCEVWLTRIRRGPRAVYTDAAAALEALATDHADSALVPVVATHYQAVALRYAGRAEQTLRLLLECFAQSDGLLELRAQVLNSLGTLYVVLGAYGAAQAVLEHAAELNHQVGDSVGEAISHGQLGSAALALGELETARRHLQRQEWFASRVGDTFGQSRALTLLGDLALDMERPDDALDFGQRARELAGSVAPPLGMWIAYSTRTVGRALLDLGRDEEGAAELGQAQAHFRKIGNQLGEALVNWDLTRRATQADPDEAGTSTWHQTAWAFASLGLTGRVAQVLSDLRSLQARGGQARATDLALAAGAQIYPHLSAAQEVELVYSEPATLTIIATRRIEGQRNLGRLAALTLAEPGLFVAVVASARIGCGYRPMPSLRSAAALAGQLPGLAVWVWSAERTAVEIARDLSSLRAAAGEDARAAIAWLPEARVVCAPFAGEVGAELQGADIAALVADAVAAEPGTLQRDGGVAWSGEAEALARMSGLTSSELAG